MIPSNATATYFFTSSNNNIFSVSSAGGGSSGYIHGNSPGKAILTVKTDNDIIATAEVIVSAKIMPESFSGIPTDIIVRSGEYKQLSLNVLPVEATTTFNWKTNDVDIVRLGGAGSGKSLNIYGLNKGTAVVTVCTKENLKINIVVTVGKCIFSTCICSYVQLISTIAVDCGTGLARDRASV